MEKNKTKNPDLNFKPHTKINSRWIIYLNGKNKNNYLRYS